MSAISANANASDSNHIQTALTKSAQSGLPFLPIFCELLSCDAISAVSIIAKQLGLEQAETEDMLAMTPAFELLPFAKAVERSCALFRRDDRRLLVVLSDPFDKSLHAWLDAQLDGRPFSVVIATAEDIRAFLAIAEQDASQLQGVLGEQDSLPSTTTDSNDFALQLTQHLTDESRVVRLVNSFIYDGFKIGASDIHVETTATGLQIKYRVDGVLETAGNVAGSELTDQVISRIKVLAELDIAERRIPQDGRFRVHARGRVFDIRVSIMPSVHGEDAVLRVLDKANLIGVSDKLSLETLGFDHDALRQLRELTALPYGMLLVTGPTGSGKTTTLYAALSEINDGRDKIVTIEDPVEYQLAGVLQIPVNEKKGLSFARGLRSILRHDPDKIMVGEIRDSDTAQIAIQSALTGHLVLSTVHANSVFDVFNRFTHMGCDPYALASALNGIWAQRLLRTVCARCSTPYQPSSEELLKAGRSDADDDDHQFVIGKGCGDCRGTGYRGRKAVAEILRLDDEIRDMLISRAPISTLKSLAFARGMRALHDVAWDAARRGETTIEEVCRVTLRN